MDLNSRSSQFDQFILGANPLVGVDHASGERARQRALFMTPERVVSVVKNALSNGATGFNFPPDRIIHDALRKLRDEEFDTPFGVYPILPDTQSLGNALLTKGTLGAINELLNSLSLSGKTKALFQGGLSWLQADPFRGMKLYIDIEVERLSRLLPRHAILKAVFAHEMITDMILGLRLDTFLKEYIAFVSDQYHLKAGLITRNFPRLVEFCMETGIPPESIVIMTPFNKIGFQMTPSRADCERALAATKNVEIIAMSVLAAGRLALEDAFDYVKSLGLTHFVVGVSSDAHAIDTFRRLSVLLP